MTIRLLPQVVADAIAAGEVVERPASVVKELVENALDAGARRITVDIEGGGQERIVVADDGAGVSADELPLALARHATSKLSTVRDLDAVGSLGFRGEALASIAAVSRLEFRSSRHVATQGAALRADYGISGLIAVAPPIGGTQVEVRGLFENTPARRAFLKRPATEAAAVTRVIAALGLSHPDVGLRLALDGRRALDMRGDRDIETAFRAVQRGVGPLLPVDGARGPVSVSGVIAGAAELRRTREHLYLSVNGRPIVSRALGFAVEQAYRGLVQPGSFPMGALNISMPAELLDVNVHPTKREVRFHDEREVFGCIQSACLMALSGSSAYAGGGLLSRGIDTQGGVSGAVAQPARDFVAEGVAAYAVAAPALASASTVADIALPVIGPASEGAALRRGPFRLVGQVRSSYIVAEGPEGLVLVDQHAAHERVLFNQLASTPEAPARIQAMLIPALLHLTPAQAAFLDDARADLAAAGLVVEDFGGDSVRLAAHDVALKSQGLDRLALDVLDALMADGRETDAARRLERTRATVACHAAVRFGQQLSRDEMDGLLRQLEVADPGITCPHGRPTILEISEAQLRREFRRS